MSNQAKIRILQIIHLALTMGVILFIGVVYINYPDLVLEYNFNNPIFLLIFFISIAAIIVSNKIYFKKITSIDQNISPQEKFPKYQEAMIIRLAIIEGTAMLNVVSSIYFQNLFYLVIALAMFLIMIYLFPSELKIKNDLQLSDLDPGKF